MNMILIPRCAVCKHWQKHESTWNTMGQCISLLNSGKIEINLIYGNDGACIDSIDTDAEFLCFNYEQKEEEV